MWGKNYRTINTPIVLFFLTFYFFLPIWYNICEKINLKGEIFMRNYKVKTKVKNNFNDTKTNITYEKDDDIILF